MRIEEQLKGGRKMDTLENTIIKAAHIAGKHIRENALEFDLEWKGKDNPVTNLDKEGERLIKEYILEQGHEVNFIGEEEGEEFNNSNITLYLDPIDGTKSFINRQFLSSVSIGAAREGKPHIGVVYDFMRDLMYVGGETKAYGLNTKNWKSFQFLKDSKLSKPRISLDSTALKELITHESIEEFAYERASGSIALSLAQIAAGTYDAQIRFKTNRGNSWDVAGALPILEKTGIKIHNLNGETELLHNNNQGIIAYHPKVEGKVKKLIETYM